MSVLHFPGIYVRTSNQSQSHLVPTSILRTKQSNYLCRRNISFLLQHEVSKLKRMKVVFAETEQFFSIQELANFKISAVLKMLAGLFSFDVNGRWFIGHDESGNNSCVRLGQFVLANFMVQI